MFAILPGVVLALLIIAIRRRGFGWREASVMAALAWGVMIVGFTEILSLFNQFTFSGLLAAWSAAILGVAIWIRTSRRADPIVLDLQTQPPPRSRAWVVSIAAATGAILLAILVIAIVSPPNN